MKSTRAPHQDRWLLALGVVTVLVHLFANQLMGLAMGGVPTSGGEMHAAHASADPALHGEHQHAPTAPTPAPEHKHRCCDLCGMGNAPALAAPLAALPPAPRQAPQPPALPATALPPTRLAYASPAPRGPPVFLEHPVNAHA